MAALLFHQAFNIKKIGDPAYLLKFAGWISQSGNKAFQSRYKTIMDIVDKISKAAERQYGYSHPRFFKTQLEYDDKLKPKVAEKPI